MIHVASGLIIGYAWTELVEEGTNNLREKNNKNPYKNNRDPTCWLGPLTRTASSYAGVQEVCISPAQRDKKCAFRRHKAKHVFKTLPWTCGYKGFDCGRSSEKWV